MEPILIDAVMSGLIAPENATSTQFRIDQKREEEIKKATDDWTIQVINRIRFEARKYQQQFPDMTDEHIYQIHSRLILEIANKICLAKQRRKFVVDEHNRDILRFLLLYFNECDLCESVFPEKKHKVSKNILLMGGVGTGKTLMMQIFSEYLRLTNNPNFFHNLSVTQMVNYYTIHNNLDRYTFNEENSTGFMPQPMNVCLNDIGIESKLFYGMDTKQLTNEFIHARNEIWTMTAPGQRKFGHLTTNLDKKQLEIEFEDQFGRIKDRFKTYNILTLTGESRR